MREQELLNQILDYLNYQKGKFWRMNTGAIVSEYKGRRRFFKFGAKGMSDIIGIWFDEAQGVGYFVAIECKIKPNKPTEAQSEFLAAINEFGGRACVAYSIDDVEKLFNKGDNVES